MLAGDPGDRERTRSPQGIIFGSRRFVPDLPVQSGIESPGHDAFRTLKTDRGMTPDDGGNPCIGSVDMGCRHGGSLRRRIFPGGWSYRGRILWSAVTVTAYLLFP